MISYKTIQQYDVDARQRENIDVVNCQHGRLDIQAEHNTNIRACWARDNQQLQC